jgi:hypothetical protein
MKTILLVTAVVAALGFAACESSHSHADRTDRAPVTGPTTGIKSQSTHAGNSDGSRTDLR